MRSFTFIFALLFLTSFALSTSTQSQKKTPSSTHQLSGTSLEFDINSSIESFKTASTNPLFKEMVHFGVAKVAQKLQSAAGIQFSEEPRYQVISIRSAIASGLEVTFDIIMEDVNGEEHDVTFTVVYQAWKNYMALQKS